METPKPPPVADPPSAQEGWEPVQGRFVLDLPMVSVTIAGHEGYFVLDTGAPDTFVDTFWAKQAGLSVEEEEKRDDQIVADSSVWGAVLNAGGEEVHLKRLRCASLSHMATAMGAPIVGFFGNDYFQGHVIRLDYVKGVIARRSPEGFSYRGQGTQVPLNNHSPIALTLAMVTSSDGDAFGTIALLDTGFNSTLSLSEDFAKAAGIKPDPGELLDDGVVFRGPKSGVKHIAHIRGTSLWLTDTSSPEVEIGETFSNLPMQVGGGSFHDFFVIIDYTRSRMIFEPNPAAVPSLGLETDMKVPDSGMRIKRVVPGLLAD